METKLKMIYWKGEKFWVGKLIEYPDIMTQGKTLESLNPGILDPFLPTNWEKNIMLILLFLSNNFLLLPDGWKLQILLTNKLPFPIITIIKKRL